MINRMTQSETGSVAVRRPQVIAVTSGKGGVGKSVIAYNLADHLALAARVLLIDADFYTGNLHLLANAVPMRNWLDFPAGRAEFADVITPIRRGLDLLASGNMAERVLPEPKRLAAFAGDLRDLADQYDFVIIDTATGLSPQSLVLLHTADDIILVTTPELTAISNCYALYKVLIDGNPRLAISLLVNQEDRDEELAYINQKFSAITRQFLNQTPGFLGGLGHDRALTEAVAHQTGVRIIAPESKITALLAALAGRLAGSPMPGEITGKSINYTPLGADIRE